MLGREQYGALVSAEGRQPMVWIPGPGGDWMAVPKDQVPMFAPPTPQPLPVEAPRRGMDPMAQRMLAGGVLAAGVGVGGFFVFSALAAMLPGLVVLAVVAFLCVGGGKQRGGDTIHVTNINRWWGRSTTRIK